MMQKSLSFAKLSRTFIHFEGTNRGKSTIALSNEYSEGVFDEEWKSAKPYKMIPGPKALPVLGNILRFLPIVGEYWNQSLTEMFTMMREKYGDIVRLEGIPGRRRCVFLFDPNHFEKIYRTEGSWPSRISLESMAVYRARRNDVYKNVYGLVSSQGEDWQRFRSRVNQHLMQPRVIRPHVGPINQVSADFINKIRSLRDKETLEMPASFNNELNKWALESICVIAFDQRVGCLESNITSDSEPQLLINNVHAMFDLLYKLEVQPSLWKIYETRDLKRFFRVLDDITRLTGKYVHQAKQRLENRTVENVGEKSILEKLISVDEQTATIMIMDMLIAGVDTTGTAACGAMYFIAANPEVQEKIRKEACEVLPNKNSPVTMETLNNIPYMKAVIKEILRLTGIASGNLRTLNSDVVIGGYRIPKGDDVMMCHAVISQDPQQFPDPMKFLPERWLKETSTTVPSAKNAHPFAHLPFGFGPRSCIGRRFAQLELETLFIKLLRNFRFEWHHGELKFKIGFISTIATPLRVKAIDI